MKGCWFLISLKKKLFNKLLDIDHAWAEENMYEDVEL